MLLTEKQVEFRTLWGAWIEEVGDRRGGWDWFVTHTFRDRTYAEQAVGWTRVGVEYCEREVHHWLTVVEDMKAVSVMSTEGRFIEDRDRPHFFAVTEMQHDRGVAHAHLLVGGVRELRRTEAWEVWHRKHGFSRILPYEPNLGAAHYLCKYVTKQMAGMRFSENLELS